jgi:drug/metabolite transporter (DMT)-like permease
VPPSALLLVLAAALLHAGWNVLVAGARDVRAATTVTLTLSVLLFAPVALATWKVQVAALPWVGASATLELAYFALLVGAYTRSDVSLVYPVARGSAPVLVLLLGSLAGATVGPWQSLGVILVGVGVILVRGASDRADKRGLALALAIGLCIAGYTLVDKRGIEHAAAIPYLELVLVPVALSALTIEVVTGRLGALRSEVSRGTVAAALASFGAYALVLTALALAPAAAVAAVREAGILFAVALGGLVLREPVGPGRVAGAALVVVGVALVAAA